MRNAGSDPHDVAIATGPLSLHLEADHDRLAGASAGVYVGVVDAPAISAAISVDSENPVLRRARARGIVVVRRTTGGTIVVIRPGDVVWSLVIPLTPLSPRDTVLHAYDQLGRGVVEGLRSVGVDARWDPPVGVSADFCLLSERGSVLTLGGRALGGAAQHASARALLHHGVIARTIDRTQLAHLFDLTPELLQRTTTSLEEAGVTLPSLEVAQRIRLALRAASERR